MSAFLCTDKHFTELAAAIVAAYSRPASTPAYIFAAMDIPDNGQITSIALASLVANELKAENLRSLNSRYADDSQKGFRRDLKVSLEEFAGALSRRIPDAYLAKSAACYEYQACESDDWENTKACKLIRMLERQILRRMPGWEEGNWGEPRRGSFLEKQFER